MRVNEVVEQIEQQIDCSGCQRHAHVYVEVDGVMRSVKAIRVEDTGGPYEDHPPIDLVLEIE